MITKVDRYNIKYSVEPTLDGYYVLIAQHNDQYATCKMIYDSVNEKKCSREIIRFWLDMARICLKLQTLVIKKAPTKAGA